MGSRVCEIKNAARGQHGVWSDKKDTAKCFSLLPLFPTESIDLVLFPFFISQQTFTHSLLGVFWQEEHLYVIYMCSDESSLFVVCVFMNRRVCMVWREDHYSIPPSTFL